jgi:4-amino-4-deoxy-L-arabinose transferase-like glycosyltransferase
VAWVAGIVLFFSIPNAKLAYYILPAMPAIAILIALFLIRLSTGDAALKFWRRVTSALAVASIALGALGVLIMLIKPDLIGARYQDALPHLAAPELWSLPLLFTLLVVGWFWLIRRRTALGGLALMLFVVLSVGFASPVVENALERRSARQLCRSIADQITGDERLASLGAPAESLTYYLNRTIVEGRRRDVAKGERFADVVLEELRRPGKVILFLEARYCARMFEVLHRDFEQMSDEEVASRLPPEARLIAREPRVVVLRNDRR